MTTEYNEECNCGYPYCPLCKGRTVETDEEDEDAYAEACLIALRW